MKAIIPVAGAGVNLRPHTYTQPKPLIPVAGKPIVSFIIDQLTEAGVEEFVFILGYLGDKIKNYLTTNYPDLNTTYVLQDDRKGLGHAILLTKEIIKDEEDIVILLGDTIIDMDMNEFIQMKGSVLATQKVKDPRQFGVVEVDKDGIVAKVVEKPAIPKSNMAIAGLYKISDTKELIAALEKVYDNATSENREVHLAEGLMTMIEGGNKFKTYEVSRWYDCGKKDILLETNKMLLAQRVSDVGTQFIYNHTIIIPPVIYGKSCEFTNAIIGPNVTLGDNVHIENSFISDSILGDYVQISGAVLTKSIIGNDASIKGLSQSLNIGDNNEIDFSN